MLLFVCGLVLIQEKALAQRECGAQAVKEILIARDPSYALKFAHRKEHAVQQTMLYEEQMKKVKAKTTAVVKIPIVFHIVLNANQINNLGGAAGIRARVLSQVEAINNDFNKRNSDTSSVPSAFKPLIGNAEIEFGLPHRKPDGSSTEGFEIITTTESGYPLTSLASGAKYASTGGADTWDPTRYLNVWIVNITPGGTLGFTLPPFSSSPGPEDGIVLTYGAFGVRSGANQYYLNGIDKGRTLTHEIGHYFNLDHVWGDDGGFCPTNGGSDDGVNDTPPQADHTYNSSHPGGVVPYPLLDNCTSSGSGIMWMNFMDYVNDAWMYMFTHGQVSRMRATLASTGISHSLTQHPELFDWPTDVASLESARGINIYPNPTTGTFNISFADASGLREIAVLNLMGQTVYNIKPANNAITNYTMDLTGLSKGVYMVQCTFDNGTITRKLAFQ